MRGVVPGHCHWFRRILKRSFHAGFLTAIELVFKSSSAVRFAQTHLDKRNNRKFAAGSQLIMLSLQCKVQSLCEEVSS